MHWSCKQLRFQINLIGENKMRKILIALFIFLTVGIMNAQSSWTKYQNSEGRKAYQVKGDSAAAMSYVMFLPNSAGIDTLVARLTRTYLNSLATKVNQDTLNARLTRTFLNSLATHALQSNGNAHLLDIRGSDSTLVANGATSALQSNGNAHLLDIRGSDSTNVESLNNIEADADSTVDKVTTMDTSLNNIEADADSTVDMVTDIDTNTDNIETLQSNANAHLLDIRGSDSTLVANGATSALQSNGNAHLLDIRGSDSTMVDLQSDANAHLLDIRGSDSTLVANGVKAISYSSGGYGTFSVSTVDTLSASSVPCSEVEITNNTAGATLYVGFDGSTSTSNGLPLGYRDVYRVKITNLNKIYLVGSTTVDVRYVYTNY